MRRSDCNITTNFFVRNRDFITPMLRESELRALQMLQEEMSITGLAAALDCSTNYASEIISSLDKKELVYTRRDRLRALGPLAVPFGKESEEVFEFDPAAAAQYGSQVFEIVPFDFDGFRRPVGI